MRFEVSQGFAQQIAILARQRRDVGDGAEADQLEEAAVDLAAHLLIQGLTELVGDTHRSQDRVRRGRRVELGVDDRGRLGQDFGRGMVIGDDDVDAELRGGGHLLPVRHAAVGRDDQPDALSMELADRVQVQAMPFGDPVRDVGEHPRVEAGQDLVEHGGGRHAVGVEVAVDGDGFPLADGPGDAVHGLPGLGEEPGLVGGGPLRVEKGLGVEGRAHTAVVEQLGDERGMLGKGLEQLARRQGQDVPAWSSGAELHRAPYR